MTYVAKIYQIGLYIYIYIYAVYDDDSSTKIYADINESGQNRLEWLEILEILWSVMRFIFKTSSVTPDFYVFIVILSFLPAVKVLKKICSLEIKGANVPKRSQHANATCRNIVGRNMLRAFGHRVAMCCNMLAQIWPFSNLSQQHPTRCNTSQHGGQTHATCCDMLRWHVAIICPGLK